MNSDRIVFAQLYLDDKSFIYILGFHADPKILKTEK